MAASFAACDRRAPVEPSVEVVLFDLGGVLIEVGWRRPDAGAERHRHRRGALGALAGLPLGPAARGGALHAEAFAAGVVADWELAVTPAEFLATFGPG